ncbi:cytochrome C [Geomonas sp. Red32]|uniref:c-type cytochrome n=1 Tax=Geomonas sp. Red32 TaxID=2912856 RepID=UPI00202CB643|nr:cytochrome C [Geomonas sp. Red32]
MKKKLLIGAIVIPPLLFGALFLFVLYEGPRMTVQHHLREFQMIMPQRPADSVTATPPARIPSPAEAAQLKNPLPPTPQNLAAARVYYLCYCVFCHGDSGAGDGPVGESYIPRPADLRSARVAGYRDGQIVRAMLTGVGHEPVLERVVPPEYRWYLALHVRSLSAAGTSR